VERHDTINLRLLAAAAFIAICVLAVAFLGTTA
jgi:hypothetical protein